ncbi:MAG: glycosyltransferase family 4 protein [Proteobacteria bacterium]|nr:glycosyltransferase family 4 protein [Pseudomonadota bacterium]
MKILHLISQHPESTGSGFYLQNIIRQAAAAGHENFLIAGMSGERIPPTPGIDRGNCRFIRFAEGELNFAVPGMSNVMPYPSSRFDTLTPEQIVSYEKVFAETIRGAAQEFSPDILHSHHLWMVSALARRILPDLPMVSSCHSTDLRQFVQCPHLRQRVLPDCLKINRLLALSQDQRDKIKEIYGIHDQRIDIVGGGYDDHLFVSGQKPLAPPIHFLYAGKLSQAKGVDWLLRTFIGLEDSRLHLHLAGSGSGEEEQLCLQLAEQAGAQVTVHGRISQQELARLMGFCHIFILPSFYEGLPLVLLEALAAGCRIIATDLPGCRELMAKAGPDLVNFVKLPTLSTIDRPDPKDWQILQIRLTSAITKMAARVQIAPSPAPAQISAITSAFSWQAVFARIILSYEKAMAG